MREIDYNHEYPIKAFVHGDIEISVREMRKDEMPESDRVFYCDVNGQIYGSDEADFEIINDVK